MEDDIITHTYIKKNTPPMGGVSGIATIFYQTY